MRKIKIWGIVSLLSLSLTNCEKNRSDLSPSLTNNSKKQAIKGDNQWDVLGHGYDVTGHYLDDESISRAPVLDVQKFKIDYAGKVFAPQGTNSNSEYYYGSNASKFVESINTNKTFNASASIGSKDNLSDSGSYYFGASFNSDRTKTNIKDIESRFSYGRYEEIIEIKKLQFTNEVSADLLTNYLTSDFIENATVYSAEQLIELYGTHVLMDIALGGRLVFNYMANYSGETIESQKISKTKGGLALFASKFGIDISGGKTKDKMTKDFTEGRERGLSLRFHGGSTSGRTISFDKDGNSSETINIGAWEQSVNSSNSSLIDIKRMVPLYHFITDPIKKSQVKLATEQYIADKQISLLGEEPVYQYYSDLLKDHFSTLDPYVSQQWGSHWEFRGQSFSAFRNIKNGAVPIYEFYHNAHENHMLTPNRNATVGYPGWKLQGVAFYAFTNQVSGTIPIYEFYSEVMNNHYVSPDINATAGFEGWSYRGIIFYAYP